MTKKEIYKQVFQILEQKKNQKLLIAEKNKALALSNEEYTQIDLDQRVLNMEIGRLKFEGADISAKLAEMEQLNNRKAEILKSLGLVADDLLPQFDCKKCNDTGIFENEVCTCAYQLANNILMKNCGVDLEKVPDFVNYDYKFFEDEIEQDFAKKCIKVLIDYVNNLNSIEIKNIVMCGASGTGKTYLTRCLAKELVSRGYTTLFLSAFDMNNN